MAITLKHIFAIFIICLINCPAYAAPQKSSKTIITSDKLIVEEAKNIATFSGHVVYKNDDTILKSELMIVFYETTSKKEQDARSIKRIEVYNNVEITTPKERATGNKGIYEAEKDTFYLLENVKMHNDKNIMSGEKFIYNKKTGKSLLLGKDGDNEKKTTKPNLILE